ncbi:thioesterase II family protein [Sphaerisporangium perillae]|uniref:thioesterase II family protein n=1 Tax=Sphaerisporangium perillae TaxID=2935860 RepID=UPI002010691F|nr:thioesterase domain-containing protein [Sphaerisporangium perillae]
MTVRAQATRARSGTWTAEMRPARAEPEGRIVVFPHAGAGPNALMPLLACLPEAYDVLGVTLPGRERRFGESYENTPSDPGAVVTGILGELAALPSCPTVFFGHSMGVAVAVAMALAEPGACGRLVLSAHPRRGQPPSRRRRDRRHHHPMSSAPGTSVCRGRPSGQSVESIPGIGAPEGMPSAR